MEVAVEVEDDLFFADLSKQISLLIMDDEDDPLAVSHNPSVSLQAYSRAIYPPARPPLIYEQACTRESKGTGVFIPRSLQPRRKQRHGRFASHNMKSNKQADSSRVCSQVSSAYSFQPKRG